MIVFFNFTYSFTSGIWNMKVELKNLKHLNKEE